MRTTTSMPLGIVLERRQIDNPWQQAAWRAVAVIPGAPPLAAPRLLAEGLGWARYHAATLTLALHRGETEGYRRNLSQPAPAIYVVLRPADGAAPGEVEPFLATACPDEGQDYDSGGEVQVDAVAMPAPVRRWVQAFVETHHVDERFVKRKRKGASKREPPGTRESPLRPPGGVGGARYG